MIIFIVLMVAFISAWFYNANSRILFEKYGRFGYKNPTGQVIVAPRYILAEEFRATVSLVSVTKNEAGFTSIAKGKGSSSLISLKMTMILTGFRKGWPGLKKAD